MHSLYFSHLLQDEILCFPINIHGDDGSYLDTDNEIQMSKFQSDDSYTKLSTWKIKVE